MTTAAAPIAAITTPAAAIIMTGLFLAGALGSGAGKEASIFAVAPPFGAIRVFGTSDPSAGAPITIVPAAAAATAGICSTAFEISRPNSSDF